MSTSKVYQQCWKEWASWCAQQGLPNNAISGRKLANFLLHLFQVGLAWLTIGIYHSAISAFLEPYQIHKASNHPVILKLMHHFYLQHPPFHKQFDPWDVEHLLSLLESWAPASSLTTFKLPWKTATLLALITSTFFFSIMLPFLFPCLMARQVIQVTFSLRFVLSLTPMLNLCPVCYLKAYLRCTESFMMKPDGSHVTSLFLGNNRQHWPVCAKTISSWVRKVLGVAKAHMSLGSLQGVAASATLAAGVSLVTILLAGNWTRVSTPARHYFSTYITTMDQHQDSVQHAVLGHAGSRSSPGKCQTLTYTQSCVCWAVRP